MARVKPSQREHALSVWIASRAGIMVLSENREIGGAKRDRTADLYNAIVALSQLSYSPYIWLYHFSGVSLCQELTEQKVLMPEHVPRDRASMDV